jgi:hypothetical protein
MNGVSKTRQIKTNYKGTHQNISEDAAKVVKLKQMQLIN